MEEEGLVIVVAAEAAAMKERHLARGKMNSTRKRFSCVEGEADASQFSSATVRGSSSMSGVAASALLLLLFSRGEEEEEDADGVVRAV